MYPKMIKNEHQNACLTNVRPTGLKTSQNFHFFYISPQSRCAISTVKTIEKTQLSISRLLKMTQNKNEKTLQKTFQKASKIHKKTSPKPDREKTAENLAIKLSQDPKVMKNGAPDWGYQRCVF